MNTPITKRMQINRHLGQKKSAAKQVTTKKPAITGQTQDASGNLYDSTGSGNDGNIIPGEDKKYNGICGTPAQVKANPKRFTSVCSKAYRDLEAERIAKKDPCINHKCTKGTPRKVSDTECKCDTQSDPSSDAKHTPVVTEAKDGTPGDIVDTYTASEMRNTVKKNKKANRYVEKAASSLNRSKWLNKYLPFLSSDEKVESKQAELEFAKQLRDVSSDAGKAGKNRFITQQYNYLGPDGKLTGKTEGTKGGEPVKAPKGTELQSDFETRNSDRFGVINAGSSMNAPGTTNSTTFESKKPGTVTTQPTNFSTLAANQEVKVGTGNLFGNLGLFTGNLYQKGQGQGPKGTSGGAFKMKGYGSKR